MYFLLIPVLLLSLAFAQSTLDTDLDGVKDAVDLCPQIPFTSKSGCPVFSARKPTDQKYNPIRVWFSDERAEVRLREKTEIKIGDIFQAIIHDPRTEEIFSESNEVEVRH